MLTKLKFTFLLLLWPISMLLEAQVMDSLEVKANPFYNQNWINRKNIESIAITHKSNSNIYKYNTSGRLIYRKVDFLIQDSIYYEQDKLIKIKSDNYDKIVDKSFIYDSHGRIIGSKENRLNKKTNQAQSLTETVKYNLKNQVIEIEHIDKTVTTFEYLKDTVVSINRANFFGVKATVINKTVYKNGLLRTILIDLPGEEIKVACQVSYDNLNRVTMIDGLWNRKKFIYDENGLISAIRLQNKNGYDKPYGDEFEYRVSYTFHSTR